MKNKMANEKNRSGKMEKYEGWDPHPTRKNIFIDQETGLLYRRRESGSFDRIPQKMTEHQELEDFRKASGLVVMTSRSRGRTPPPSDKTLAKESE
jgi:hypothetical protein